MKRVLLERIKNLKKHFIGFCFVVFNTLSLSVGCSLTLSVRTDLGSNLVNVIRLNNSSNGEKQTYWRCEPIESRKDWLGWGVKSYLTALANPWATYGDVSNNNCFLYTDVSLNQTFIRDSANDELIPISVFASPSSRSLSCFDIKLSDGKAVNTKYDFYCSKSLAELLGGQTKDQQLVVKCSGEQSTQISFDGVIESFGYSLPNTILNGNENYIVVPYIFKSGNKEEIISYDMHAYTGQASFYAVLKNDRYENNYYSLMINAIYQMGGVQNQLCYKATYIDSSSDLLTPFDDISSSVQQKYIDTLKSNNDNISLLVLGAFVLLINLAAIPLLLFKMKHSFYEISVTNVIIGSSLGLILFWCLGELFYITRIQNILFWDTGSRTFALCLIAIVALIVSMVSKTLIKNRQKEINNLEYYSIDI